MIAFMPGLNLENYTGKSPLLSSISKFSSAGETKAKENEVNSIET